MKKKIASEESLQQRAAIDGRVAFATAVFSVGAGLLILLDRIGVPERLIGILGPVLALTGLGTIGLLLRSMRISSFYAGSRYVPAAYAGLATAALGIGLFSPFAPPVPAGTSVSGLLLGFGLGLATAALGTGPFLRKTGAFSITDLVAARFPNTALRLGIVLVVSTVGFCIALAGFVSAVHVFGEVTDLGPTICVVAVAVIIALVATPGGVAGVVWTATGAGAMLVAGLALPLAWTIGRGGTLPLPVLGDRALLEQALARMAEWHGAANQSASAVTILSIVLGLAALGPLLTPSMATHDRSEAWRGGWTALIWTIVIGILAICTMALSTLALQAGAAGLPVADVPDFLLEASRSGVLTICGQHPGSIAEIRSICSGQPGFSATLRATDVTATGEYLLLGLSELRGFGAAFSGLAAAGALAVSVALSATGFITIGTALGNDAFYRVRDVSALTSRRLAITRLIMIASIVATAIMVLKHTPDARFLIGFSIALCAAAITPLLLLALWPRAEGAEATVALLVGIATAEGIILLGGSAPSIGFFAEASVIACGVATVAGFAASFLRSADPTSHGAAFVHGIIHGESEVLRPDKGA